MDQSGITPEKLQSEDDAEETPLTFEQKLDQRRFNASQFPHPDYPEESHEDWVYSIASSDNYLVSGSRDKSIRIWDMKTQRLVLPPLHGHESSVLCVQFDEEADLLISGATDTSVIVWQFSTGKILKEIKSAHLESVLSLKFNDDYLVTGSKDRSIKVWDIKAMVLIMTLNGHNAAVNSVALTNNHVVSGSGESTIRIWSLTTGKCAVIKTGHDRGIASVQVSSDGKHIVSASSDSTIRIYNFDGIEIACLRGHRAMVRSVQLVTVKDETLILKSSVGSASNEDSDRSPFVDRIVSGSYDGTVKIWRQDENNRWDGTISFDFHNTLHKNSTQIAAEKFEDATTIRVYSVQFTERKFICAGQAKTILAWDFGDTDDSDTTYQNPVDFTRALERRPTNSVLKSCRLCGAKWQWAPFSHSPALIEGFTAQQANTDFETSSLVTSDDFERINRQLQENKNISMLEIENSAARGCLLCRILEYGIKSCLDQSTYKGHSLQKLAEIHGLRLPSPSERAQKDMESSIFEPVWDKASESESIESFSLKFFALEGQQKPFQSIPYDTRQIVHTGSAMAFERIEKWLKNCNENHQSCKKHLSTNPKLPTRVLDVGYNDSSGHIKLLLTTNQKERYVCLSHRWGRFTSEMTTTKNNMSTNTRGISWSRLPKTFQDAVTITRKLKIRYLWIDSLCIIQDDTQDWERESAQMASIFENAYITIAGTSAFDSTDGLFSPIDYAFLEKQLPGFPSLEAPFKIFARRVPKRSQYSWDNIHDIKSNSGQILIDGDEVVQAFPLLSRGWVFQERMLSVRVLHFTACELIWECLQDRLCLCNCMNDVSSKSSVHVLDKREVKFRDGDITLFDRMWRVMVQNYSRLLLSKGKDKLPALSGIAQHFLKKRPFTKYLAGLWSSSLIKDLTWRVLDPLPRPSLWRGPTWSWVSANGQIDFDAIDSELEITKTKILESGCNPLGLDPTGEVSSGYLLLSGPLLQCEIILDKREVPENLWRNRPTLKCGDVYSHFNPDYPIEREMWRIRRDNTVYLLWVSNDKPRCLVLQKVKEEKNGREAYKRMGYCLWTENRTERGQSGEKEMSVWKEIAKEKIIRVV